MYSNSTIKKSLNITSCPKDQLCVNFTHCVKSLLKSFTFTCNVFLDIKWGVTCDSTCPNGESWDKLSWIFFREWDELLINSTRPNGWAVGWVELGFFVLVNCRLAAARSKSRNKKIKIKIKEKWVSRRDEPICIFSSKPAHVLSSQSKHGLTLNT